MTPRIQQAALGVGASCLLVAALVATRDGGAAQMGVLGAPGGSARVEVEQLWEIKGPPRMEFGSIGGMAEGDDGSVWVSDDMNRRLVRLTADGGDFRIIAKKGAGPGELGAPTMIAGRPGGGLAVYDIVRQSLELYASSGKFQKSVPIDRKVINPKGFAVLGNGEALISGGIPEREGAIHRFGADGRLAASWHPIPRSQDDYEARLVAGGPLTTLADGSVVFSQAAPHRVARFTPAGREVVFAEDEQLLQPIADHFSKEENGWKVFRWWFPQSKAVFVLPDGRMLNVIRNAEEHYSLWEVYSRDGRRRALTRINRAYSPWAMAHDGTILASYTDPETDEHVAARLKVTLPD